MPHDSATVDRAFQGAIDDVTLWTAPLTESQIQDLYELGTKGWDASYLADIDHVDDDDDNIPDRWETAHGLSSSTNNADMDSDGDGVSDYHEDLADTDPTNNASFFEMHIQSETGSVTTTWDTSSNRFYSLLYNTNLMNANAWAPINDLTNTPGTGGTIYYTNALPEKTGFYKLIAAP